MKQLKSLMLVVLFGMIFWSGPINGYASGEDETRFGYLVDAQITDQFLPLEGDSITAWVEEIGRRVVAMSGRPHLKYTFRVLIDPVINAFSGPGGYIYITSGFLDHIESDDELAAVLAHEVAHVSERHQVEAVRQAKIAKVSSIVLQSLVAGGAAALSGVVYQGMTAGPYYSPGQALMAQLQADMLSRATAQAVAQIGGEAANMMILAVHQGFSRGAEQTADKLAVHYLYQTGFDMEGFVSVLKKLEALEEAEKKEVMVPHFLASHPDIQSRIANVRSLIAEIRRQGGGN